jgi:hypothetical protein
MFLSGCLSAQRYVRSGATANRNAKNNADCRQWVDKGAETAEICRTAA